MVKSVPAIYENGVLRPLEPLDLSERQRVAVVESPTARIDAWLDLSGNLADDIRRQRDSRGSFRYSDRVNTFLSKVYEIPSLTVRVLLN